MTETIVADVSDLALGQIIRAGELNLPEKVILETEPGVVVAHVIAPKKVEEVEEEAAAAPEEEEAAAEPEVIKKGKAEEDEGSTE
jgi:large subunit ribosomal protein L25